MWTILSKILINIVIAIISDKVLVESSKKMIIKAVDSTTERVGISNEDAKDIIHNIAKSGLNSLTDDLVKSIK